MSTRSPADSRRRPGVLALGLCALAGLSFRAQTATDTTTILVSLIERPIGRETFSLRAQGQDFVLEDTLDLLERGSPLRVDSTLRVGSDLSPTRFQAKGKSYRFINVDTEVDVANGVAQVRNLGASNQVNLPQTYFTALGYAPLAGRALLIRYWERHQRPAHIGVVPGVPTRDVTVRFRGNETVRARGRDVRLRRYTVDGVVWGRETVWLDDQDRFAAIVTRIHILPLEGIREDLAEVLPTLQRSVVGDQMQDLAEMSRAVAPIAEGTFALSGATLVDGTGTPALNDAVIVVSNGRISMVGPRATTTVPRGTRVIDVKGKTITPGLWEMHAHAAQIEWAPAYLGAGVTTMRDMGGEELFLTAFRDSIASGKGIGPRLLLAGLVDGDKPEAFGAVTAATPAQGRAIVDRYHGAGFQQLKLYTLLSPEVTTAIIDRAHELKMTVTGHVPTSLGIIRAVEAGMDHVAHMPVNGDPSSPDARRTIELLARRRTVVDPTLPWNELLGHAPATRIESFEPGFAFAPPALAFSYRSVTNNVDEATAATRLTNQIALVRAMHDAGVPIVAGTDAGVPGVSLLRSLELYVRAGFTPMEALQSATLVPARSMGMEAEVGTIEVDKRADLLVLDANPLTDISNIRKSRWVVANGRMFETGAAWRAAGFVGR